MNNLLIEDFKKIKKKTKQHKLREEFTNDQILQKKQKLIADIMAIDKQRKKISKPQQKPKKK